MSDTFPSDDPWTAAQGGGDHEAAPAEPDGPAASPNPARAPHHNEWTREKMAVFLRELAACQNVTQAAKSVGMSRKSAYALRNRKPGTPFALAWEVALEAGLQQLAHALMDRALNGEEVPHYYHGELVGTYRKFDNRLAAWMLENPWKVGRHQIVREREAADWEYLIDRVEFGDEFDLEPTAEEQAAFEALLSEEERAILADPRARMELDSWYVNNLPMRSRRGSR